MKLSIASLAVLVAATQAMAPSRIFAADTGITRDSFSIESQATRDLKFKIRPTVWLDYLNFDFSRTIVNQTIHSAQMRPSNRDTLILADYSGGVRVNRMFEIEAGFGGVGEWHYEDASGIRGWAGLGLGLVPVFGRQLYASQWAPSRDAAKSIKEIRRVPEEADGLRSWHIGDFVTYAKEGGVVFFVSAGNHWVGPGVAAAAKGTWTTYVEKIADDVAYIKLTKAKVDSLSIFLSSGPATVDVSQFRNTDDSFSFAVNISNEEGKNAYSDILNGNVAGIQKLVSEGKLKAVMPVEARQMVNSGRAISWYAGLPFVLGFEWKAGKSYAVDHQRFFADEYETDLNYGMYFKEWSTSFFWNHSGQNETFYGGQFKSTTKDGSIEKGLMAQYSWHRENAFSSHYDLRSAIKALVRKTGLQQLVVNVPKEDDLHYTSVRFSADIPQVATISMLGTASAQPKAEFVSHAMSLYEKYFGYYHSDPDDLCADHGWDRDRCTEEMRRETISGASKMWTALTRMRKTMDNDVEGFSRAFALFGEGMTTNQFTFRTALMLAGAEVEINYLLEGEMISKYPLNFVTDDGGNLRVLDAPEGAKLKRNDVVPYLGEFASTHRP